MTSRVKLLIHGKVRIDEEITAANVNRIAAALREHLPGIARKAGAALVAVVEENGVAHVVRARKRSNEEV